MLEARSVGWQNSVYSLRCTGEGCTYFRTNLLVTEDLGAAEVGHTLENAADTTYCGDIVKASALLYRVGLPNITAFNTICSDLSHYESYSSSGNPAMASSILPDVEKFTAASGFHFDADSGVVDVGQGIPDSVIGGLGEGSWGRSAVQDFLRLCPR